MSSTPALFTPIQVGAIKLQHRVVLAPLTRLRAGKKSHVPNVPLVKEYYTQRASRSGTLLITEATFVAPQAGGEDNVPGIWSQEQIEAWKEITASVHEQGSYIFLQLWSIGRAAHPDILKSEGLDHVAPSPIPLQSRGSESAPRELTVTEIEEYFALYAAAAQNALKAGFDGVEVNGVNGFLVDQIFQDVSNQRTDQYGGSIENRSRFALGVVKAVADAVGEDRVGMRVSPWNTFQDMGMKNPVPQFAHFVSTLKQNHPNLAYLHAIDPVIAGIDDKKHSDGRVMSIADVSSQSNDFLRAIWKPKQFISDGGYERETALSRAKEGDMIAFGRRFIANPDLVNRLEKDIPLTQYNRDSFFIPSEDQNAAVGYIDYPFAT